MIEAGAPSTEEVVAVHGVMPTPTGRGRKAKDRVLRGSLALDALHLLARDVDRAGELVGLEHPAFDHILNRRRSEAEILGRFHYGDFLAVFVFHPNNTFPPGKDWGRDTTKGYPGPDESSQPLDHQNQEEFLKFHEIGTLQPVPACNESTPRLWRRSPVCLQLDTKSLLYSPFQRVGARRLLP